MLLYLYRHGETEENRQHILQGCMPGTLTEEGKAQIAASIPALQSLGLTLILCSDIQRCKDTALIINEVLQLPIVYTPLLRERDWGSATGMVVDGVTKIRIPDDAETLTAMRQRAQDFLTFVRNHYTSQTVLAISHGLFCRQIQAVYHHVEIADIVRMKNTEFRLLELA
ncbi:MAG: histidine phosphatase family protein [Bacteroidaceae bacterium]|nr:histidine phosphatase family protein [Bacteroidaceae bacterium]